MKRVALRLTALLLLAGTTALQARADVFSYEFVEASGRNNVIDSNAASCDSIEGCYTRTGARCSDNPNQMCDLQIVPAGRCTYGDLSTGLSSCVWPHRAGHCQGNAKVGCLTSAECSSLTPNTCLLTTDIFGAAYAPSACTCQGTNSAGADFETVVCGGSLSVCSDGDPTRDTGGLGLAFSEEIKLGGVGSQTFAGLGPAITGSSLPNSSPAYALESPPVFFDPQRDAGSIARGLQQGTGPIRQVRRTEAREILPYSHPTIATPVDVRKSTSFGDSQFHDWAFQSTTAAGVLNTHLVSLPCDAPVGWVVGTALPGGLYCHEAARNGISFDWGSDLTPAQVAAYTVGGKRVCPPNCNKDFDLSTTESQELSETGLPDPNAGIQLAIESGEEGVGRQAGAGDSISVTPTTWMMFLVDNDLRCKIGGWGNTGGGELGRCSDGARVCHPGPAGDATCAAPPSQGGSCRACIGPITGGNPLGKPLGYNTHDRMELDLVAGQRIGGIAGATGDVRIPLFVIGTSGNAASNFRDKPAEGSPAAVDLADMGPVDPASAFGSGIGAGGTFIHGAYPAFGLNIAEDCCATGSNIPWDAAQQGIVQLGLEDGFSYRYGLGGGDVHYSDWALTYDKGPGPDGIPGCIGDNVRYPLNGLNACDQRLGVGAAGPKTNAFYATGQDDRAIRYTVGAANIPASSARFSDYGEASAVVMAYFGSAQNPPTVNSVAAFALRDLALLINRSDDALVKLNTTACPLTASGPVCSRFFSGCSLQGGDTDQDYACDNTDNCLLIPNQSQLDTDLDGAGNICDTDDDNDGLLDSVETGTGTYVSPGNTGSNPLDADSDDDGFEDGFEVAAGTNPNQAGTAPLFTGFEKLDGGSLFTCGILTNGELSCFGSAPAGQPADEPTDTFKSLSAGADFVCALHGNDTIECWGSGAPTVPGTPYLQIAAGSGHACGLAPDLSVDCFGDDLDGQASPPISGQFTEVIAGASHSCALGLDGHAECWGAGTSPGGQSDVPADQVFVKLAAGQSHTCGLRADGSVLCWGSNAQGQTGVSPGTYTQLASGSTHTCGLTVSGTIQCWGSNASGQTDELAGTFIGVFAGPATSCGIRADQRAECWGANGAGEATPPLLPFPEVELGASHGCELSPAQRIRCFGDNGSGQSTEPVTGDFVAIGVGADHSCAIETDGDVVCFGSNTNGQSVNQSAAGNPFVQVDGGFGHTCAVRANSAVTCWGASSAGQSTPDLFNYVQVSAGGLASTIAHSCGITTSGALRCWGTNTVGQSTDQTGTWTQVSAGGNFSCGVRTNGTLACWGDTTWYVPATLPVGLFTQVATGNTHACALAANGTVQCWGDATGGKTTPAPGSYKRISVNGDTSCGVLDDGSIACWGDDALGQASPALEGDGDNRAEGADNCPADVNATQIDGDSDGVGDACEACLIVADPDQFDRDQDGVGDACDNCVDTDNPLQEDNVGAPNGIGNACERTLLIIRPALPPPPGPPGAPSGFSAPAPPPAGEAIYDVFLYCPAVPIRKVQLGVIMPTGAQNVSFGLGCTPSNCLGAVGNGLNEAVDPNTSFALGPENADPNLPLIGARADTVYFSIQATAPGVLCPSTDPVPQIEVRVAQFQVGNPAADLPTPSLTTEGLSAPSVNLLQPLVDDTGQVLEPAEYAFASQNQDPAVTLSLAPAVGDTSGKKWQVELDANLDLKRVTFGLMAPAGTTTAQMRFTGCTTTVSGPPEMRRSCAASAALGPYVSPATSFTVGPGASTSGLRGDTLYVSIEGARASGAVVPALNVLGQPVVLGVVELDSTSIQPALTLEGVGTTAAFATAYVDTANAVVATPLVQIVSGYNAPSDNDADGRSDDLDNCPYTSNSTQANNGGFMTPTPDVYGDLCQCADGDDPTGIGIVNAADTAALRSALTGQATGAVVGRCSVAGGPECDVLDYAVFKRALAGLQPAIKSVCASAVRGSQLPTAP